MEDQTVDAEPVDAAPAVERVGRVEGHDVYRVRRLAVAGACSMTAPGVCSCGCGRPLDPTERRRLLEWMDAGERGRVAEMAVARRAVDDLTGLLRKFGCTRGAAELGDWHQRAALAAARPSPAPAPPPPAGVGYVEVEPTDTEDLIAGRVAYDICVQRNITLPDGWRTRWFRRAQDHEIREFTDVSDLLGFTPNRGHEIWLRSALGDKLPETVAHELDHMLRPLDVDPDVHEHLAARAGQMYALEYRERWPLDPFESW